MNDLLDKTDFISVQCFDKGKIDTKYFKKQNGEWGMMHDSDKLWVGVGKNLPLMIDFINNYAGYVSRNPKYYTLNGNRLKVNFWGKVYETS